MRTVRIHYIGLMATVFGLILIALEANKTIHLRIDGETKTISTYAFNVGGLLRDEHIALGKADLLEPSINHWLREGDVVIIERAARVHIQDQEKAYAFLSTEDLPANLLAQVGIEIYPGDRLYHNGLQVELDERLPRSQSISLQIQRATPVRIIAKGQNQVIHTTAPTIGQALWQAGISLYAQDQIEPSVETPVIKPTRVDFQAAREFSIITQDNIIKIRTTESIVGSALAEAGIALQGLDYSIPKPEAPLPAEGRIRIVHVEEKVDIETEPLPFESEFQPVSDLELDKQSVINPGTFGIKAKRVRVRLEDGEEVSRSEEAEFIAQEPEPRILGYGTKIVPYTTNTPEGTIKYWRALNMYAVSYNPTSAGGNITASGLPLRKGLVAVDPTYIPLGTRLYIPGYGEALAADTGGGVNGRIIDLGYSDHDYVPWHQWVTVYFLWPPPENIVPVIP